MSFPIIFESMSEKCNGIAFHHKLPRVLTALENGSIQLWDFWKAALLWKFDGHRGAVRGICFHENQPIFVSGGEDKKIKLWNYERKTFICTLHGHTGVVRTTFFHDKYPWILSASDDQTAMIWNWNTERCIAKLSGLFCAVSCAQFRLNFVYACSLDSTILVWDISSLIKKQKRSIRLHREDNEFEKPKWMFEDTRKNQNKGMYANHKGFLWIACHSTAPYILFASKDTNIKVSSCDGKKLNPVNYYRGHENSVTSAVFHEKLVISCSEDKSIRLWDVEKVKCLHVYRRENERFWALATHPSLKLIAAGHDNGSMVFKLHRQRPPQCIIGHMVYYVDGQWIMERDCNKRITDPLWHLRDSSGFEQPYHSLSINLRKAAFLLTRRSQNREKCSVVLRNRHDEVVRICGISAFWVGKGRFAALSEDKKVSIRDLKYEEVHKLNSITIAVDDIFYAGTRRILLKSENELQLYDIYRNYVIAYAKVNNVRRVIWSKSMKYAALLSKNSLMLVNSKLEILCTQNESENVKSGAWDGQSVFIYNTRKHLKYVITSGDCGIIKSLDAPLYISVIRGTGIHGLNNNVVPVEIRFDPTEYKIKLELNNGKIDEVNKMMISSQKLRCHHSLIGFFEERGYPEIALKFVTNEKARFRLSLLCGNLDLALEAAERLDEAIIWKTLGEAALLHGNHQIVEKCYRKIGNFEKLLFLYFVTGNTDKLVEMMESGTDANAHFEATLLIGNIEERIKILRNCGQTCVAYLAAATHGYINEADELKEELEWIGQSIPPIDPDARLLVPPPAVCRLEENWSLSISAEESSETKEEFISSFRMESSKKDEKIHFFQKITIHFPEKSISEDRTNVILSRDITKSLVEHSPFCVDDEKENMENNMESRNIKYDRTYELRKNDKPVLTAINLAE